MCCRAAHMKRAPARGVAALAARLRPRTLVCAQGTKSFSSRILSLTTTMSGKQHNHDQHSVYSEVNHGKG